MKRNPRSFKAGLSDQTIQALLNKARGEWKGLILIGLHTGQRLRDIAGLDWLSVDLEKDTIRFHVAKTRRTHIFPIAGALREYLVRLQKPSELRGPVFPGSACHSITKLNRQFVKLAAMAGVDVGGFQALRMAFLRRFL